MSVTFKISLPFEDVVAIRDTEGDLVAAAGIKADWGGDIESFLAADAMRAVIKAAKGLSYYETPTKKSDAVSEHYCGGDDDIKHDVAYSKNNRDYKPCNVTVPIFDCPDALTWSANDNWETSEWLKVTVQDAMRKEKRFEVEDSTTFAQLARAYAKRIDAPMWSLTFKYHGQVIHNETLCTLKDLSIRSHSVIEVCPSIDEVVEKRITVILQDETAKFEDLRCATTEQGFLCDLAILWGKHTGEDLNDFYFNVDGVSYSTTEEAALDELDIYHGDAVCIRWRKVVDVDCEWDANDPNVVEARKRSQSQASLPSYTAETWGARSVSNAGWLAKASAPKASKADWAYFCRSHKGSARTVSLQSDSEWAQTTPSSGPGGAASSIDDEDRNSIASEPSEHAGTIAVHVNTITGEDLCIITHAQDTVDRFWDQLYRQAGKSVLGCDVLEFVDGTVVTSIYSDKDSTLSELGVSERTVLNARRTYW